jgi:hypothetical protein
VVSDTMTFDAIEGILFYGFSNYRLVPRNNNDFIGANLTLDSVSVPTSPLNIVELGQSTWTYYPNPVRDLLNVEATTSGTVQLFNAQGRIVHSTDFNAQTRIDVSALPTGMYILKLQAAESVKSARIFIQH